MDQQGSMAAGASLGSSMLLERWMQGMGCWTSTWVLRQRCPDEPSSPTGPTQMTGMASPCTAAGAAALWHMPRWVAPENPQHRKLAADGLPTACGCAEQHVLVCVVQCVESLRLHDGGAESRRENDEGRCGVAGIRQGQVAGCARKVNGAQHSGASMMASERIIVQTG